MVEHFLGTMEGRALARIYLKPKSPYGYLMMTGALSKRAAINWVILQAIVPRDKDQAIMAYRRKAINRSTVALTAVAVSGSALYTAINVLPGPTLMDSYTGVRGSRSIVGWARRKRIAQVMEESEEDDGTIEIEGDDDAPVETVEPARVISRGPPPGFDDDGWMP